MKALRYENLIQRAFGFKEGGRMLDRWGDPASLANTDAYRADNLAAAKVGAGYAMEILTTEIINAKAQKLAGNERTRLEGFTERVVDAKDLDELSEIIEDFVKTVEDQYFVFNEGIMSLA